MLQGAPDADLLYKTLVDVLTGVGGLTKEELERKLVCVGCAGLQFCKAHGLAS